MLLDKQHKESCLQWLALTNTAGIGAITCQHLLNRFSTPAGIFSSSPEALGEAGLNQKIIRALLKPNWSEFDKTMMWLERPQHHLITCHDPSYPPLLKEIDAPPPVLFAVGRDCRVLKMQHFAMVGSRHPSRSGVKLAEFFAEQLAHAGMTICSGLALGIDYHSHQGALNAHKPTIAVLGSGIDTIYPKRHRDIANQITEDGLLLSEYLPGVAPSPEKFPQRNRIISGMSIGTLIVEATRRSGSLITANHALNQGRDVFAIPGAINNPLVKGTHYLIKQGAKLVESIEDILEEYPSSIKNLTEPTEDKQLKAGAPHLDSESAALLEHIGYDVFTIDEIAEISGLAPEKVSSILLTLELEGIIESRHGGKYCRCTLD